VFFLVGEYSFLGMKNRVGLKNGGMNNGSGRMGRSVLGKLHFTAEGRPYSDALRALGYHLYITYSKGLQKD
jgi:hypothetical protein